MAWTIEQLAWAAGFFEGEGHVQISKSLRRIDRYSPHYTMNVEVANTNPLPLHQFHSLFGGSIYERKQSKLPNRAKLFRWSLSGNAASGFLKAISPYLIFKKEQAKLAITFQKTCSIKQRGIILTAELIAYREALHLQLRELTQTGYKRRLKTKSLPKRETRNQLVLSLEEGGK